VIKISTKQQGVQLNAELAESLISSLLHSDTTLPAALYVDPNCHGTDAVGWVTSIATLWAMTALIL